MTDTSDRTRHDALVARLYRLRLDEDLTWDQIARLVGLHRSTVMQWCATVKVRKYWDRKIVRVERLFALPEADLAQRIRDIKKPKAASAAA